MKILQLNPAFYPAFAYGGTVSNRNYIVVDAR